MWGGGGGLQLRNEAVNRMPALPELYIMDVMESYCCADLRSKQAITGDEHNKYQAISTLTPEKLGGNIPPLLPDYHLLSKSAGATSLEERSIFNNAIYIPLSPHKL